MFLRFLCQGVVKFGVNFFGEIFRVLLFSRVSGLAHRKGQQTQRALRSKKINPDRKSQSRLEIFNFRSNFSISIENFNPRVSIYGALVVYREGLDRKFQSTIDRSKFSIPKAAIEFFQSPGPLGKGGSLISVP